MQCWCCPLAATECCPPVRVTPEDPAPTEGVPPREGVPTRSEGRVPAAAMGAMRPLHLLTVPAVRVPRAPTPPPPPCLPHRPKAVSSPGCSQRATGPEPTPNPLGQKREPTSRTHLFANPLSANPREPTANPPFSRTHLANPREPTANPPWRFPCEPTWQVGSRKVGSNRGGFEEKWVRVETIPNPIGHWVRSGFDPPRLRAQGLRGEADGLWGSG